MKKNKKCDPPVTRSEYLSSISKLMTKEDLSKTESRILNAIDAFMQKSEKFER